MVVDPLWTDEEIVNDNHMWTSVNAFEILYDRIRPEN